MWNAKQGDSKIISFSLLSDLWTADRTHTHASAHQTGLCLTGPQTVMVPIAHNHIRHYTALDYCLLILFLLQSVFFYSSLCFYYLLHLLLVFLVYLYISAWQSWLHWTESSASLLHMTILEVEIFMIQFNYETDRFLNNYQYVPDLQFFFNVSLYYKTLEQYTTYFSPPKYIFR